MGAGKVGMDTHLLLLLVEVVDDDTDEEVEGEEGSEDDEDDKIEVHVEVHLVLWLLLLLQGTQEGPGCAGWAWRHTLAALCSPSHSGREGPGLRGRPVRPQGLGGS